MATSCWLCGYAYIFLADKDLICHVFIILNNESWPVINRVRFANRMDTIVLGINHYNTLGLIWSLGVAGHNVTLLLYAGPNAFVNTSRFLKKVVLIHEGDDVIEIIKQTASDFPEKPVVLVSSDADAALLNDHFLELSKYCFFEGGQSDGSINKYRDKDAGNRLAIKCGLTVPDNIVVSSAQEFSPEKIQYPIIVKANNSINGGKTVMKKCCSKEEAGRFVASIRKEFFPIQVQRFVDKEYEIMLLGCSLYGGRTVLCPVANKKIRHFPSPMGIGSYSESIEVRQYNDLLQLASKVSLYLQDIEYTGNFSAEFLYSKGEYFFLEINLRNDGTSWLSTCSGYNLPDMVCRSFVDMNVDDFKCEFHNKYYMNILYDFNHVRQGKVSLWRWLQQFAGNTCYSNFYNKDWHPFCVYIKHFIKEYLKKKAHIFDCFVL